MGTVSRWACCLLLLSWASGCDCAGPHHPLGSCAGDDPPPSCGQDCTGAEPCPGGYYCAPEHGVCTQDCDPLRPDVSCADGVCSDQGRCTAFHRDGGTDASGVCADVRVGAMRVTPNVVLVVDQSGSMDEAFGSSDRWNSLRDSLLDTPDGLIAALETQVRFGIALYSAEAGRDNVIVGMCPQITWVGPALNNYAAIEAVYGPPTDPIDETPTGESLDAVLDMLSMSPDPTTDPTIFILATDGEPDTCAEPNPQNGQPEALAAVERAYRAGVRTFIISVGEDISRSHLQDVANAGIGAGAGDPDAEFWVAGDDVGLRNALRDIIGGALSCIVTLEGEIQDISEACVGRVELNGVPIPCDDPNGWRAIDGTHIELSGDACDILQSPGSTLTATFPCGVILI